MHQHMHRNIDYNSKKKKKKRNNFHVHYEQQDIKIKALWYTPMMELHSEREVNLSRVYPLQAGLPEKELASYKAPWPPATAKCIAWTPSPQQCQSWGWRIPSRV